MAQIPVMALLDDLMTENSCNSAASQITNRELLGNKGIIRGPCALGLPHPLYVSSMLKKKTPMEIED